MPRLYNALLAMAAAFCLSAGSLLPHPAHADTRDIGDTTPVRIPDARQFDLRGANGRQYRVFVAAPRGDAPAGGFPVLYLLDGNAVFGTAVETARLQQGRLGPVVIVAIGYPVDTPFDGRGRMLDYTPPTDPEHMPSHFDAATATGGHEAFLDVIVSDVRPLIESLYPVDPQRQALFGHSLGGLFVLHTLFTRPGLFQKYIAGSPSIWWNARSILGELDRFRAMPRNMRGSPELMVVVGGDEMGHVILDARTLMTQLPAIRTRYREIPAQDHIPMLPAAINEALGFALSQHP